MLKPSYVLSLVGGLFTLAAAPLVAQATRSAASERADARHVSARRRADSQQVGCTAGACHGAAKGKNGFKLSLRGYDPQFDYESLLYDLSGRRFNRADPGRSLMLAKPSQEVAHGGGRRFAKDSDYYKTIYNWIAQGVPYGDPAKDTVVELRAEPAEILMTKPGETASLKVVARYQDDQLRDVTRETIDRIERARRRVGRGRRIRRHACHPGRARRRSHAAGALSRQVCRDSGDRAESQAGFRVEAASAAQLYRSSGRRKARTAEDSTVGPDRRCDVLPPAYRSI